MPLCEARDRLSALVDDAQFTGQTVTITRHGRPAAVLMAVDDRSRSRRRCLAYQPGIRGDLAEAEREIADGARLSPEQLRDRLRALRP